MSQAKSVSAPDDLMAIFEAAEEALLQAHKQFAAMEKNGGFFAYETPEWQLAYDLHSEVVEARCRLRVRLDQYAKMKQHT